MDRESAMHLILRLIAECGVYSHEIAKAKATRAVAFAHEHRHPLQCASGNYWPSASTGRQKAAFVRFCEVAADTEFVC
jgi:hypothetical protein